MKADTAEIPPPNGAWSFSALMAFEALPYRYFVENRLKIRGPGNAAMERGSRVHESVENYVQALSNDTPGSIEKSIDAWQPEFERLRELYLNTGQITIEEDWAYDYNWDITGWTSSNVWLRSKLDVFDRQDETSAHIIDWKTGRKFGNEMKHQQQGILYAISSFMRFPELQFVRVEFLYLDQPYRTNLEQTYTREQAIAFEPNFRRRANEMLNAPIGKFAPPMHLDGLPKYQQEWLRDPANYGHEGNPFDPPWYVNKG